MTSKTLGIVTDCLKLNIYDAPKSGSRILGTVSALSEVEIFLNTSTVGWYHICTSSGVEGYCKKKFLAVK